MLRVVDPTAPQATTYARATWWKSDRRKIGTLPMSHNVFSSVFHLIHVKNNDLLLLPSLDM